MGTLVATLDPISPKGSMYPYSIYLGLKLPIGTTLRLKYLLQSYMEPLTPSPKSLKAPESSSPAEAATWGSIFWKAHVEASRGSQRLQYPLKKRNTRAPLKGSLRVPLRDL